jgi:hypothetical protein
MEEGIVEEPPSLQNTVRAILDGGGSNYYKARCIITLGDDAV